VLRVEVDSWLHELVRGELGTVGQSLHSPGPFPLK